MIISKNIIKSIKYSIRQISEVNNKNIIILFCDVIRRVVMAFCLILIPQNIVSRMLLEQYQEGAEMVMLLCAITLISEITIAYINRVRNIMQVDININLNNKMGRSIMETEYEKIETKSYLEKIDFAKTCIDRNSVLVVYNNLIEVLSGAISLVGIFYIISKLHIAIVIIIALAVIVSAVGEVYRLNYVFDRDCQGNEIERNLYYARNDLASNQYAKDIRILNLFQYVSEKVEWYAGKLCELWTETSIKSVKIVGWTYVANGIQYIIIYSFLAYMCYQSRIDISEFILYSSSTIAFGDIVKNMLGALIAVGTEYRYIESINQVLEQKEERECNNTSFEFKCKIEFVDVWYKFQGSDTYIFEGLNLVIEKNKTYSIVGKNGAGKTTLVKLILGLYKPEIGHIYIDGVCLEKIDMKKYRSLFSCVFQDYNIYGFTIRENISFEETDYNKMDDVFNKSGLTEEIKSLPEGTNSYLNREINENAMMLSGGQEQQLAIARALYKDSAFFILDEPTAALSPSSEFALYQQFKEIAHNKTVIFISHRLASCILCDEIIVIDEGKIIEQGNHAFLMEKKGLYAEMFETQAKPYKD